MSHSLPVRLSMETGNDVPNPLYDGLGDAFSIPSVYPFSDQGSQLYRLPTMHGDLRDDKGVKDTQNPNPVHGFNHLTPNQYNQLAVVCRALLTYGQELADLDLTSFDVGWISMESLYKAVLDSESRLFNRHLDMDLVGLVDDVFYTPAKYDVITESIQRYIGGMDSTRLNVWAFLAEHLVLPMWTVLISAISVVAFAASYPITSLDVVSMSVFAPLILVGIFLQGLVLYYKYSAIKSKFDRTMFRWARGYVYLLIACDIIIELLYPPQSGSVKQRDNVGGERQMDKGKEQDMKETSAPW